MARLVFDAGMCTGCNACALACSFRHERVFAPHRARVRVLRDDENGVDVPVGCTQCDEAPCMTVCPTRALRRGALDEVVLDAHRCIGCAMCLAACPFGAIWYDALSRKIVKCDLCGGEPECVGWCFTEAIRFVKTQQDYDRLAADDHADLLAQAAQRHRRV